MAKPISNTLGKGRQIARVTELDATRGVAMLAVCLAHSAEFLQGTWTSMLGSGLRTAGMVATPTFLLLSGVVSGYLGSGNEQRVLEARWRLLDRGVFLLLVAHLAIGLTIATWSPVLPALLGSVYITDAVGVGLIFAAFSVGRISARRLVALGLTTLLLSCLLSHTLQPHTFLTKDVVRMMFGLQEDQRYEVGYIVPLVPYLGIFMVGIAGGMKYSSVRQRGVAAHRIACWCIGIGAGCIASALLLKALWLVLQTSVPVLWRPVVHDLTALRQKMPPGLCYALNYGGIGTILSGLIGLMSQTRRGSVLVDIFAVVGRASLVLFILQYWLYYVPARVLKLNPAHGGWFFTLFGLSLLLLWTAAWLWDRTGSNRFLTLGLRRFAYAEPVRPQIIR